MSDFLCALPLIANLLSGCAAPLPVAAGYVEGEYVLLAPVEIVRIDHLGVKRGDHVEAGDILARMEKADAEIALRQAEAALEQSASQLANLKEGRRPEEIAVIEAALTAARAQAREARRIFSRQKSLRDQGIATEASFEQAATALDQADAQVQLNSANLAVARLPARPKEIDAAQAMVRQAEAAVENARWRLGKREVKAPARGVVHDIIRRAGEMAGPSQPVLTLLPDGAVKLRLYAGEKYVSSIQTGSLLKIRCDGCGDDLTARVSFVSDSPEFTPPVIYSIQNRQKLVYLVEARPDGKADRLKPGQIVDVILTEPGP